MSVSRSPKIVQGPINLLRWRSSSNHKTNNHINISVHPSSHVWADIKLTHKIQAIEIIGTEVLQHLSFLAIPQSHLKTKQHLQFILSCKV